jgi:hypothetical protein
MAVWFTLLFNIVSVIIPSLSQRKRKAASGALIFSKQATGRQI